MRRKGAPPMRMEFNGSDGLLDPRQVARRLGVSTKFLEKKRHDGGFIPFVKIGSLCRYTRQAVDEHIASNQRTSTSE